MCRGVCVGRMVCMFVVCVWVLCVGDICAWEWYVYRDNGVCVCSLCLYVLYGVCECRCCVYVRYCISYYIFFVSVCGGFGGYCVFGG